MNFSASGGHEKDLATIVTAFEKANPGITVNVQNVAYADYFTKLQTAVAGGTASDAFELTTRTSSPISPTAPWPS